MLPGVSFYAAWPITCIKRTVRNHSLSKQQPWLSPGLRRNAELLKTNPETCISNRFDLQNPYIGNLPVWFPFIQIVYPILKCHFYFHIHFLMLQSQEHLLITHAIIPPCCKIGIFHLVDRDTDHRIQKLRGMQLFKETSVFFGCPKGSAAGNLFKRSQFRKFV